MPCRLRSRKSRATPISQQIRNRFRPSRHDHGRVVSRGNAHQILLCFSGFACPSCGQHISATSSQIGMWAPCPNCSAAVTVPTTSTLPPLRPVPLQTKRYKTTVILIDDYAAEPAKTKKLEKWTDDFTDARNWLIRELGAFHGKQYFAGIFDHRQKRSVFKEEKGRGSPVIRERDPGVGSRHNGD
jgi:hypothetical protein